MIVKIEKALNRFIFFVSVAGAAVMVAMMLYVCADALMRNLNRSFVGSNELVMNVVVVVIFLGIGMTSARDAQIKIDVFRFFPKMDYVTLSVCMLMYFITGIAAFRHTILVHEMSLSTPFLSIPHWPFVLISGIGLVLCALGTLCVLLRKISGQRQEGEQ
ncbi:MAG: TRAP transporter small permease subunit [Oscillospiraceae bacterium]|nr:TRAP transporter small permease subunit [Oscillospiraceae bacterium]